MEREMRERMRLEEMNEERRLLKTNGDAQITFT